MDSGLATMIAAFIAAVVSIIGVISSFLLWYLTRSQISHAEQELTTLQARMENWRQINTEVRDHHYRQLSDFYDPVYALLATNRKIFQTVGPGAALSLDTQYPPEENANAWEQIKKKVIIPNNHRICEIITTNLHLLHKEDLVDLYMQFILHAKAYEVFTESPYEGYTNFRFPDGFLENVEAHRIKVKSELGAFFKWMAEIGFTRELVMALINSLMRLKSENLVNKFEILTPERAQVILTSGRSLIVYMCADYIVGVAAIVQAIEGTPRADAVVYNQWDQPTTEARIKADESKTPFIHFVEFRKRIMNGSI